jgi:hypothetical protein
MTWAVFVRPFSFFGGDLRFFVRIIIIPSSTTTSSAALYHDREVVPSCETVDCLYISFFFRPPQSSENSRLALDRTFLLVDQRKAKPIRILAAFSSLILTNIPCITSIQRKTQYSHDHALHFPIAFIAAWHSEATNVNKLEAYTSHCRCPGVGIGIAGGKRFLVVHTDDFSSCRSSATAAAAA